MYYKGTLKDGKVFDALSSGKPFKFKLGKGEVIKGWDTGLKGQWTQSEGVTGIPCRRMPRIAS